MTHRLLTLMLIVGVVMGTSACGKRGKLDAPDGSPTNSPDLPATKPFPRPIGNGLPTPTSTPGNGP